MLYQLTYTAKDPYVLGVGIAAFRDVGSFFKYAAADDVGTPNPLAGAHHVVDRCAASRSRATSRATCIYLGMNQDEANRIVHDGAWPLIAGRRVAINFALGPARRRARALPDGQRRPAVVGRYPDTVRGLPAEQHPRPLQLDRHLPEDRSSTFGGAEVFALKMTTAWVGTSADADIPLPRNVRRYYIGSTTHGGGGGGFAQPAAAPRGANCPGNNWGTGHASAPTRCRRPQMVNVHARGAARLGHAAARRRRRAAIRR